MKSLHFVIFYLVLFKVKSQIDLDNFRNSVQLIESRGFKSETHTVVTRDGYLLNVFRVVNPYANRTNQKPVIIWHGIGHNSDSWLISNEGMLHKNGFFVENNNLVNDCHLSVTSNLPLTLSSCGYDVWLPNTRGTEYSNKHQILDADQSSEYWEFTFTELGVYDARAVVEYVLNITKQDDVGYIGFSMGSTIMFVLLSLQPEFEVHVKPFIALAPFVYMSHMKSILRLVTKFEPYLRSSARPLGIPASLVQFVAIFICGNQYFNQLCADLLFYANSGGYDPKNLNRTRLSIYTSHSGITFSSWIYAQVAQIIESGTFSGFNYGHAKNMEVYGQTTPLNYPLSRITSKNIAVIYGLNDIVANITDVQLLIRQLQVPLLDNYLVPYSAWAHHNNQWGIHQGYYLNIRILRLLGSI